MKILDWFKGKKASDKRTTRVGPGITTVYVEPCIVHAITANSTNNTASELINGDDANGEVLFTRLFQGQTPMFDVPFSEGLTVRGGDARHDIVITWSPA